MENSQETNRLEMKTDTEAVIQQARWCGMRPGLSVLDAACGPGKVASVLHGLLRPSGTIIGIDSSRSRIDHAKKHYGDAPGIDFIRRDLREPLADLGLFDLVWVRFILEYYRQESFEIIRNLTECLKPGGWLCLLDLDYNCLSHYQLPTRISKTLHHLIEALETEFNFDPYAGRKLYSYLYDLKYEDIQANLFPHHLFYGQIGTTDLFNWTKKWETVSDSLPEVFSDYPGGKVAFFEDFMQFFKNPRRFSYTPLIICKGRKPEIHKDISSALGEHRL